MILFSHPGVPISRVPASGGAPAPVTRIDAARHETTHRYPWFLPDGRHFLYMAANLSGAPDDPANLIHLASIDSTEDRPLIPAYSNTVYANGYLLFERDGSLFARRFDEKRLQATGDLLPIAEQILRAGRFWRYRVFCASESGMVVYGTSPAAPSELLWFDRAGRQTGTVGEPAFYRTPRVSPDGRRLAVTILDPSTRKSDVWLYEFTRGVRTRFTSGSSNNDMPIWFPDGGSIVFRTDRKHQGDLYRKAIGGGGEEPLLEGEGQRNPDDVSPDGRFVALELREPKGDRQVSLSILPLFGDRQPKTFFQRGNDADDASFSPAGRWLAYTSQESGKSEVYVASFPGPGGKWQVSTAGGFGPAWRRDGKELYYLSADFKLMAVAIRASAATFEPAAPQALFDLHRLAIGYDAAADGQRFLIVSAGIEQSPPITLIQNWTAGLKKEARSAN